jgi:FAD/FMN-containing dehydrogenase
MVAVSPDSPSFMQPLHSDEYFPEPLPAHVTRAIAHAGSMAEKALDRSDHRFWAGRQGTAAGLIALNHEFNQEFFQVPQEAVDDLEAANEALGGKQTVIDVQTHYLADRREANLVTDGLLSERGKIFEFVEYVPVAADPVRR